jgi:hypothetical protein
METKVCKTCNENKSINEFRNRNQCKQCENKIRYQRNKERRLNDSEYNDKWKKYDVNRKRKKEKEDPYERYKQVVRQTIRIGISRRGHKKKLSTTDVLGCTYEEFKTYIESKFDYWMNWDNYGLYNGKEKYGWELDHIIPLSSVDTEEDVIRLNHYSNIQPLCSYVNRVVKRNKIEYGN